ncbi:putative transporter [Smittium culicis]|uniref:Putative transporter n=2 Tax=Smittium culicis TaxID=133412 RepID=A0A1R1XCI7_9FUNG|nr:putative transporter [Smittium culicis]
MDEKTVNHSGSDIGDDLKGHELNTTLELTDHERSLVKSALKKIDRRIVPLLSLIYIFSLIDRSNIGAALVNGLREELKFTAVQEQNSTTIFYIFYLIFETPANMMLKKVRPHVWFGLIGSAWSLCCIGMAFAKNGNTFVVARAFLGAFESGFTPGVVGYLNYWYCREEVGIRSTLFFLAIPIGGTFGGPLTAALASTNTKALRGFQMIFLVEGAITLALCIAAYFIIIDYPDEAKFLTEEERSIIVKRLNNEQGMASTVQGSRKQLFKILIDWKLYVFSVIFFGLNNLAIILGVFGAVIVQGMGFSGVRATYIASIQSVGGLFGTILLSYLLNKVSYYKLILMYGVIAVIGYSVVTFGNGVGLRLTFYVIAGFGSVPLIPLPLTWSSVNQGGVYKGLIASAVVISLGTICGVTVPRLYTKQYAPNYNMGNYVTLGCAALSVILSVMLGLYFKAENKRRDNNPFSVNHLSEDEQRALANDHPNFRFRL